MNDQQWSNASGARPPLPSTCPDQFQRLRFGRAGRLTIPFATRFCFSLAVAAIGSGIFATPSFAAGVRVVSDEPIPTWSLRSIPVAVVPEERNTIKEGSRIVISNILGPCNEEVKDALMRRLAYNSKYDVVTRDNLDQILYEQDMQWRGGNFNTRTAAKLGELLGASLFIVGRISHCGPPFGGSDGSRFQVVAALQLIELSTGKVLLSSADQGLYVHRPATSMNWNVEDPSLDAPGSLAEATVESLPLPAPEPTLKERLLPRFKQRMGDIARSAKDWSSSDAALEVSEEIFEALSQSGVDGRLRERLLPQLRESIFDIARNTIGQNEPALPHGVADLAQLEPVEPNGDKKEEYSNDPLYPPAVRAAEEMAGSFADRFFDRAFWEDIEMWADPSRAHFPALELVRLGRCPDAAELVENVADAEVAELSLNPPDLAKFLHNFGVVLLCSGELDRAARKLRSAYRIDANGATLRMLGFAHRLVEWSLVVEVDREKEVDPLRNRVRTASASR